MMASTSGQLVVTPTASTSTQQLMAKEIVDKEVEIERYFCFFFYFSLYLRLTFGSMHR